MAKRQRQKRVTRKKEQGETLSILFVSMNFFNDTGKDIQVQKTPNSYHANPTVIKPLTQESLFVRPGGFVKLWDYGKYFHLLVE